MKTEHLVSLGILALLGVICLNIWWSQFRFNPAVRVADQQPRQVLPGDRVTTPVPDIAPPVSVPGLSALGPSETYDRQTLSDKIDGKAELYLQAGFRELTAQRYHLPRDPSQWLELFVYDMQAASNAFAVYSQQRRSRATPLNFAQAAYRAANGIFVAQGPHYLEIVASRSDDILMQQAEALAVAFVDRHAVRMQSQDERQFLPARDRLPDSVTLIAADAFGFDRFNRIFTAQYEIDGRQATAFLSKRQTPATAAELAEAYAAFLRQFGGTPHTPGDLPAGMQMIEIMDTFEVIFARGPYLAGVHEGATAEQALMLARRLDQSLTAALGGKAR